MAVAERVRWFLALSAVQLLGLGVAAQTTPPDLSAADAAFERGAWAEAVDAYQSALDEGAASPRSRLQIARAQRELGQPGKALAALDAARAAGVPAAGVELERARNLMRLNQPRAALRALEASVEAGLVDLKTLTEATELEALADGDRFQRLYRTVRRRVFPCEGYAAARAFDFWVGDWQVRLADGRLAGENRVSKGQGGCVIVEQWQSASGTTGTSLNFYSPEQDEWRQVWVGAGGSLIDISGGIRDGAMRLTGTIENVGQDVSAPFRGSWTPLEDGRVQQFFEQYDQESGAWESWFEGFYSLKSAVE